MAPSPSSRYQDFGRQGWRGGSWGYFSEDGWTFALAVFLALREEGPDEARRHLKPHLAKRLGSARARLTAAPELLEILRSVSPNRD